MTKEKALVGFSRFKGILQGTVTSISGAVLLILLVSFALPLIFSFLPLFRQSNLVQNLSLVFSPQVARVAARTLVLALFSTLVALAIGIPAAFFTATRSFPGRSFLLSFSAVPLCMPPLLVALGYVMFWGMQGVANSFTSTLLWEVLGKPEPVFTFLYSPLGIVLAQGFYNFPLVMKTCGDAWTHLPSNQKDAALLLGASPFRAFRTITLVQLLPSIATSAMVVFLYCFFSFVIVLLFGGVGIRVLEVEIYQAARSSLNFPLAAALALVETSLALGVVALYSLVEGSGRENKGLAFYGAGFRKKSLQGWKEVVVFTVLVVLILLFFFLPLWQLVVSALTTRTGALHLAGGNGDGLQFSLKNFQSLFSRPSFFVALQNTLVTSSFSSVLAVVAAFFVAVVLKEFNGRKLMKSSHQNKKKASSFRKGQIQDSLVRILPLLPMAISSVVLGFGANRLVSSWWPKLGGSPFLLVLLQAALYWPLAFRQISGAMDKIPSSMVEAATILSPYSFDKIFSLYLPLCKRSVLAALGFCFALGCGDTTLPLVLAIPRFETLALYTYNLAGSYRFYEACSSGVVLAIITMPLIYLSDRGFTFKIRFSKKIKSVGENYE